MNKEADPVSVFLFCVFLIFVLGSISLILIILSYYSSEVVKITRESIDLILSDPIPIIIGVSSLIVLSIIFMRIFKEGRKTYGVR